MKIDYSYYALQSKDSSSSVLKANRAGALLKVEFQEGQIGYADCHPWVEFGDVNIEEQLRGLRKGHPTPLLRCSLNFARLDAEARASKKSLLNEQTIPLSHFLITDILSVTPSVLEALVKQGYTYIKIKLGFHLPQEIAQLLHLFPFFPLKLRFDFNEKLSLNEFIAFLRAIDKLKDSIDFIEDPIPYNPQIWKEIQYVHAISLASDRHALGAMHWPESADVLIVKPAIEAIELFERVLDKIIVTSYLDHPLGQLTAAYVAARIDPTKQKIHGLLSHHAYNPNYFSQSLSQWGPHFIVPEGPGFGYNEQLNQLDWIPL